MTARTNTRRTVKNIIENAKSTRRVYEIRTRLGLHMTEHTLLMDRAFNKANSPAFTNKQLLDATMERLDELNYFTTTS